MATLYITNTGGTGSGSLAYLVQNAAHGDVIQPDPTLFPTGTECAVTLTAALSITKCITLKGAQTRLKINGNGYQLAAANSALRGNGAVIFEDVDFVNIQRPTSAGSITLQYGDSYTFRRCRIVGCSGYVAGAVYVFATNTNTTVLFEDCAIYGNRATYNNSATSGGVYFASSTIGGKATFRNCTFGLNTRAYNSSSSNYNSSPTVVNCVTSATGWHVAPASYAHSDWTATYWQNVDPRPTSSSSFASGASDTTSVYDLDGNLRRAGGALGAFEYVAANLYWIGKNSTGGTITTGSFSSGTGWASDRFATSSGTSIPNQATSLFIGSSATFTDEYANANGTIEVGGYATPRLETEAATRLGLNATISSSAVTVPRWTSMTILQSDYTAAKLVVEGLLIIENGANATVGKLVVRDGAVIYFKGADSYLTATREAQIGESDFIADTRAYLGMPEASWNLYYASLQGVEPAPYGAGVTGATFNNGILSWTASNPTKPVLVEVLYNGERQIVSNGAEGTSRAIPANYMLVSGATARIFDGARFTSVSLPSALV